MHSHKMFLKTALLDDICNMLAQSGHGKLSECNDTDTDVSENIQCNNIYVYINIHVQRYRLLLNR